MAKQEHTPGPWGYESKQNPTRVTATKGDTVAAVYGGFVGSDEQHANARLIASAPEMYEYMRGRTADGDQEAEEIMGKIEGTA